MQRVWPRLARPCYSRNPSASFSSAALIARRSPIAPARRRVDLDGVIAVLFSTVALVSAVTDGKRRVSRQQDWVKEIHTARSELDALKADQERRLSTLEFATQPSSTSQQRDFGLSKPRTWEEVFTLTDGWIQERNALGFRRWKGIPLSVLKSAPPSQIQDFMQHQMRCWPKFQGYTGPRVWRSVTWSLHIKKVKTLEWSIALMTLQLMRHVPPYPYWCLPDQQETTEETAGKTTEATTEATIEEATEETIEEIAEDVKAQLFISSSDEFHSRLAYILNQLQTIKNSKESDEYYWQYPSPGFPRYSVNQPDDSSTADQLNAKLHALFESSPKSSDRITKILPRICFYLLTSKSPPSIHTYNLLMSEFAGAYRDDLIEPLLRSTARTHMRPNEVTLAETLRHYIRRRESRSFDRYVDRMEGFREGLGLAAPQLDIPDLLKFQYRVRVIRQDANGQNTYEYFEYSDLDKSKVLAMKENASVKVYEKPRRNLDVYQALIQGALSFHGMSEAMRHYCAMTSEGWWPNQEILLSILHRCLHDRDLDAGVDTWRRLQSMRAPVSERGYVLMHQLCGIFKKQELMAGLLDHGIQQGVLPPTVLDLGWYHSSHYKETRSLLEELCTAKDVWTTKQELEALVAMDVVPLETLERVDLLRHQLERSLPNPTPETKNLLSEARAISRNGPKMFKLEESLRDSDMQILGMTNELRNTQLYIRIPGIETQLRALSSAIVDIAHDISSTMLPIYVSECEECFDQISATTTNIVKRIQTLLFCINARSLQARCEAWEQQLHTIRKRLTPLVPSLLRERVAFLKWKLFYSNERPSLTWKHVKETMPTVYGAKIMFFKVHGSNYRWRCQLRPEIAHNQITYRQTHGNTHRWTCQPEPEVGHDPKRSHSQTVQIDKDERSLSGVIRQIPVGVPSVKKRKWARGLHDANKATGLFSPVYRWLPNESSSAADRIMNRQTDRRLVPHSDLDANHPLSSPSLIRELDCG
ncbi:MAG: hypothetical protein L6R39_005339 [Caloplaca ligustica]|nr:MAG: hypothetical protein L6R39_005339 [Caloplaca ligustica]